MNFQNIPRDDKVVKRAFIPRPGNVFHFFDYKQIEPRLLAYFAALKGDDSLASRMRDGVDPYTSILQPLYGEDISELQRQEGKVLFLSLMYGGGARTVMEQFGVTQPRARAMIRDFHAALPIVRKLQDGVAATAAARGYIRTPWGRHLHLEKFGEHKLLNKLIQGSAAHLMKRALIRVDQWLEQSACSTVMLSVIHDEIVLDGPPLDARTLHTALPELMTVVAAGEAICAVIPIEVDHEIAVTDMADKRPYSEWEGIPY